MKEKLTRRDFIKLSALALGSLAFRPFFHKNDFTTYNDSLAVARIGTRSISIYSQPSDKSEIVYTRYRDDLLNLYYQVVSEDGPSWNPLWYRVWRGYIHSAHLQLVETRLNPVLSSVPEGGRLGEISVPFSQSMRYSKWDGWTPLYRLYYESVHWIKAVEEGPDGQPWYRIMDELFDGNPDYYVPASHVRPVEPDELDPISPDVPFTQKRVEVSLSRQELTAFEYDQVVLFTKISSGLPYGETAPGEVSTNTPAGTFNVQVKMPSKHMGNGELTSDINAYELPGVPWVTFFAEHGVACHGTYWHTNFGVPMSHGCVNMRTPEAKWLYRWTVPIAHPEDIDRKGYGTQIIVM